MEKKIVTAEFIAELLNRANNIIDNCEKYRSSIVEKISSNNGDSAVYYIRNEFTDLVINDRKLEVFKFLRGICATANPEDFTTRVQQLVNQITEELFSNNLLHQSSSSMTNVAEIAKYEADKKCLFFIHQFVSDVMQIDLTINSRFL